MKDAQGHGSNAHSSGIEQVGQPQPAYAWAKYRDTHYLVPGDRSGERQDHQHRPPDCDRHSVSAGSPRRLQDRKGSTMKLVVTTEPADDLHIAKRLRRALRPRTAGVTRVPRWIRRFGLAAKRLRRHR